MNYALLLAQEAGADSAGFFTFINVLWVFVGLVFLIAVIGLLGKYLLPLFEHMPEELIEAGAYAASAAGAFVTPHYIGPTASFITAIISIPIFAAAATYRLVDISWRAPLVAVLAFSGAAAHVHDSAFFGGVSVLVLLWLFGSWIFPFLESVEAAGGEEAKHFVPSSFWSSAAILAVFGVLSVTSNPPWMLVFKPGAFWLAGTVYTGGLLTLSCRYYYKENKICLRWLIWQVVALLSGVGALFLGHTYYSYFGTTVFQEIGGTFLAAYLIQKISEIPWNFDYWPWLALAAAVSSYYALNFASHHPDYFLGF